MSLGKIAYRLYFRPRAQVRALLKQGIASSIQMRQARRQMQRASLDLHYTIAENVPVYDICFLTGQKYWYQTAFCAFSLAQVAPDVGFRLQIFDDGTFDAALLEQVKKQFPDAVVHLEKHILDRLETALPQSKFPFLHFKRDNYPHIKKLTDIYVGKTDYQLVLDSDMLFFHRPDTMIEWLAKKDQPIYILDAENSYHYSFELMQELCGTPVREKINVGLVGLKGAAIDWEKLAYWARTMEAKEGSSYYLEQALTAMLIGQQAATVGARDQYIVMPSKEQVQTRAGVLQHYVADSKEWYFRLGWQQIKNAK